MRQQLSKRGIWTRIGNHIPALLILLTAFAPEVHSQAPQVPTQSAEIPTISVNVELVVLQATVTDKNGRPAPELHQTDFQIFEDGIRQSASIFRHEDVPVTVGLVIDHSASMRPKLSHVIEAARTFARSSNPEDQMFVVNFNEKVTLGLPAAKPFTARPEELDTAISRSPAVGMTALYDAVILALDRLKTGSRAKKVLIVISDGGDNASTFHLPEVLKKAEESSALIYTIGLFENEDPDKNPDVLRHLARATGGEAYFPKHIDEVVENCAAIARDIRHQYTLAYNSSTSGKAGAFRGIKVTAALEGAKLRVRTRSGYIAGEPQK